GELLEPDGTLTTGMHQADTGILSRKSELRELQDQVTAVAAAIAQTERELQAQRDGLTQLERAVFTQQEEIGVLAEQAADLHGRVERHRDRRQGLHDEVTVSRDEMQKLEQDIARLDAAWRAAESQAAAAEAEVQRLHA